MEKTPENIKITDEPNREHVLENEKYKLKLQKESEKARNNPNKGTKRAAIGVILTALILLFSVLMGYQGDLLLILIVVSWAPLMAHIYEAKRLEKKLSNYGPPQQMGWTYFPGKSVQTYRILNNLFPRVFDHRIANYEISNQYWGEMSGRRFWSGSFARGEEVYTALAFKLKKKVAAEFTIKKHYFGAKMKNQINKKAVTTTSNEFNSMFTIEFKDKREIAGLGIYEVLGPNVVQEIINLSPFLETLIFREDEFFIIKRSFHLAGNRYASLLLKEEIEDKIMEIKGVLYLGELIAGRVDRGFYEAFIKLEEIENGKK